MNVYVETFLIGGVNLQLFMVTILDTIEKYFEAFPEDREKLPLLSQQCENGEELTSRKNFQGHVTGSGFVVQDGKVFLIFHKILKMYLQPGGHYERSDRNMLACAFREVREETGLDVQPHTWHKEWLQIPFLINTHEIPRSPQKYEDAHYHHDHFYLFLPSHKSKVNLQKAEVEDYKWEAIDVLAKGNNIGLRRAVERLQGMGLVG